MVNHLLLTLAACAVLTAGCSEQHTPLAAVSGSVLYQGQPLPEGTIVLQVPGFRSSTGKIVDGQIIEVTTFDPCDGAPVGEARIAVFATAESTWQPPANKPSSPAEWTSDSAPPMVSESVIPDRYNDPGTSGLSWTIKAGENILALTLAQ